MRKSPFTAFLLAFIPGAGHLYIGKKIRGLLYPFVFFGALGLAFITDIMLFSDEVLIFFLAIAALSWGLNMLDIIISLFRSMHIPDTTQQLNNKQPDSLNYQPVSAETQNERFFTIMLSFIPGVGHFHLGLNQRGLTFLTGFFGIITMVVFVSVTTSDVFMIFLLALPIIWIYSLFDAIGQLNKKQAGVPLEDKTIMDDLESFRQDGKKSKMLATVLSIFPGAGHMYLGLQKRGLQLMAAFLLSVYVLDVLHLSIFLFLIPIIWFYSFFDALQLASKYEEEELEDVPVIKYLINNQKWIGIALVVLGVFYLLDSVLLPTFAERLLRYYHIDLWYYYQQYFQVSLVCLLFIGGGIKLIAGSKRKKGDGSK
ncbi:hypothetical protein [Aquibacillus kalidii]|uniref:hypothetical protein n=1 Tax=Aquibacillus kalidii TaxID=2762597 RepID=UPI0016483651|nr:hypothetical protein [Aquibacillus kalidii]